MNLKTFAVMSSLLVAATGALAGGPMTQSDQSGTQRVTSHSAGFNDDTTGPTNPRGPVQSPDWV